MVELTGKQKSYLRGLGHHLEQALMIGAGGVTEGVIRELSGALDLHELVKVRLGPGCTGDRKEVAEALSLATDSAVAQILGKTLLLFRPGPKNRIVLP